MAKQAGLPNLLIIGAAKCGTTSLHHYLDAHPEIAMSRIKELDFFTTPDTWNRGIEWYSTHFSQSAAIRGESSTSYTTLPKSRGTVDRIAATLEEPRFIYLVRHPLKRLASHYHHRVMRGGENRTLDAALADATNPYIAASRYGTQVAPFIERFGSEAIFVESQERLGREREQVLYEIFEFLGVRADVAVQGIERQWEESTGKGWGWTLGWHAAGVLRRYGVRLPQRLRWPAQRLLRSRVLGGNGPRSSPPEVSEGLRDRVGPELEAEVAALRELTGKSFDDLSL